MHFPEKFSPAAAAAAAAAAARGKAAAADSDMVFIHRVLGNPFDSL